MKSKAVAMLRAGLFIGGVLLLAFLILPHAVPVETPADEIVYGYTYSTVRAEDMGYDSVALYERLAEALPQKQVRIPVYWDRIAPEPGVFDFTEVDALLAIAATHQHEVTLAIGQRVPRWPECFVPEWTNTLSSEGAVDRLQEQMIMRLVERYADHENVVRWQVQNEPFFGLFGECDQYNVETLETEVAYVQQADPETPVMLTGSGEQSLWRRQAGLADIVGTSVYRIVHNNVTGYLSLPVPAWTYRVRARMVDVPVIISELQLEPWLTAPVWDYEPDAMAELFPIEDAEAHVAYAERIGFPEVLLWGVEWAAYMEDHGHTEYMEQLKTL